MDTTQCILQFLSL